MNKVIRNVSVIFMALIVLFSTLSFTIDMHYCGKRLVDVALFKEAKTCGMKQRSYNPNLCSMTKKSCCTDKQLNFEGQEELKTSLDTISIEQQLFIAAYYCSYISLFKEEEIRTQLFREYPPPLVVKDIYLYNESFLI